MPVRISVRLDEATKSKLEDLAAETHKSIAEIITEALDLYYQRRQQAHSDNQALLDMAGCLSGPADLSTCIKDEFAGALNGDRRGHR